MKFAVLPDYITVNSNCVPYYVNKPPGRYSSYCGYENPTKYLSNYLCTSIIWSLQYRDLGLWLIFTPYCITAVVTCIELYQSLQLCFTFYQYFTLNENWKVKICLVFSGHQCSRSKIWLWLDRYSLENAILTCTLIITSLAGFKCISTMVYL